MSDNSNHVRFVGERYIPGPYLAIRFASPLLRSMTRCRSKMDIMPLKMNFIFIFR